MTSALRLKPRLATFMSRDADLTPWNPQSGLMRTRLLTCLALLPLKGWS